ncbi:MAG: ABC transporter ATP-binding protein [Lachnospirales bacterium]
MAKEDLVVKSDKNKRHNNGPGPNMMVEKPKDFKNSFSKLLKLVGVYKIRLIIVIICSIVGTCFTVISPKILGSALTQISTDLFSLGTVNFDSLTKTAITLLSLYLVSLFFSIVGGIVITKVSQDLGYSLRKQLSEKINKVPLSYFDKNKTGDTISRVTNDVDTIAMSLNQSLPQVLNSVVSFIGTIYMMITINVRLALICFVLIPLSMFLASFVIKKSQNFFKDQQALIGQTNGYIEESFSGLNVIKANTKEKGTIEEFQKINYDLQKVQRKATFISSLMMPIMDFVGNIGYVLVTVVGSFFVASGVLAIGDISAYMQYVKSFMQPIVQISQATTILQSTVAAAERVFEFLEEVEEDDTETVVDLENITGNVSFKNVNFGYEVDTPIIKDFSIEIYSGRKIAIVGPTGAGKTTILKLLMRFYEIQDGNILIDGKNITDFSRADLRNLFGIVLQDTWLMNGTILENIKFGNEDATFEEVVKACKMARIHHFIKTLPEGYNTTLNEEVSNISEGQKQLLTIARALISNPKILILDEATSNVDTRTEKLIQEAMFNLMENRTSFVIAHRLSTILDSDLILVMDKGDVIEAGNHKELINKKGFYYDLYNSQFAVAQ